MDLFGTILFWVIGILAILMVVYGILYYLDRKSKNKLFCTVLKWHKTPKWQDTNGFDYFGICPRCGQKIYQDKWGSWDTRKEEIDEDTDTE